MPIDCVTTGPLILVKNHAGITLPFSTGILATSVLATGCPTPLAYDLAARIADDLHAAGTQEIDSEELVERTAALLDRRVGNVAADRFRAFRQAKHVGVPLVLCLSGAPGVGKSTIANRLALRLGVRRVVPTDAIREVLRTVIPATVLPELHLPTHEAVRAPDQGDFAASAYVRQARAVGGAAVAVAERMAREGRSVLVEGAQLLPGEMRSELTRRGCRAIVIELLLTLDDERMHRSHLLRRTRSDPALPGVRHLRNFSAIRLLQQDLRAMARGVGVMWHDLATLDGLTEWIVDRFTALAGEHRAADTLVGGAQKS
jgi:2-phosphoglycerate kinase